MIIQLSRFGEILTSRPEGREAALVLLSTDLRDEDGKVEIDFDGVVVLTPSWLSEFIQTLNSKGIKEVSYLPSNNGSVTESIKFVDLESETFRSSHE